MSRAEEAEARIRDLERERDELQLRLDATEHARLRDNEHLLRERDKLRAENERLREHECLRVSEDHGECRLRGKPAEPWCEVCQREEQWIQKCVEAERLRADWRDDREEMRQAIERVTAREERECARADAAERERDELRAKIAALDTHWVAKFAAETAQGNELRAENERQDAELRRYGKTVRAHLATIAELRAELEHLTGAVETLTRDGMRQERELRRMRETLRIVSTRVLHMGAEGLAQFISGRLEEADDE